MILDPRPADLVVLVLVVLVGLLAFREREAVADTEGTRRTEAESFARILRALARSVSPDAIVAAIVEELGVGTGADHVAVVRRRPESRVLDAVLSSTRPGAPTSRTSLPLGELDDPAEADAVASLAVAASSGRRLTAVPIDPDPGRRPRARPAGDRRGPPSPDRRPRQRRARGLAEADRRRRASSARRPCPAAARRTRPRPGTGRASGSRTGSPPACPTPTGCPTCSPRRCASTARRRARSSSRGARARRGR